MREWVAAKSPHDRCVQRSALEVTEQYLARLEAAEPQVRAFITVAAEQARTEARALDERIGRDGAAALGPLAGVPLGIKVWKHGAWFHVHHPQLRLHACSRRTGRLQRLQRAAPCMPQDTLCTAGLQTTAGARVLRGYVPSYDATAVARLRAAGAFVLGKCNCDAFAMGSTTESSDYQVRGRLTVLTACTAGPSCETRCTWQVTRNPWDLERVPGGSSGGSAAAVSSGQCVGTLGSDTGGCWACLWPHAAARAGRALHGPHVVLQAAAYGSRRTSVAWWASSRPTGACRAAASSRTAPPWTAWGPWRGPSRTPPSCSPPLPARGCAALLLLRRAMASFLVDVRGN